MFKGSSTPGGGRGKRYNRVSLARHDDHSKKEDWDYRFPKRRKGRDFVHVRRYEWDHGRWVLVEKW